MHESNPLLLPAGLVIIAAAVYAVVRRVEVRLALGVAALALGLLAGDPLELARRVALPLLAGLAAVQLAAIVF